MSRRARCRSSAVLGRGDGALRPPGAAHGRRRLQTGASRQHQLTHDDLQEGLIFLGIAGMMDPPRPEAIDAIHACQNAGIRVKMITGDHPQTAMSIGQMLGITNAARP
jgi:magnesium-transporting ATPase (P-type)